MILYLRAVVQCVRPLRLKRFVLFGLVLFIVTFVAVFLLKDTKNNLYVQDEDFYFHDKGKEELSTSLPNSSRSLQKFLPIPLSGHADYMMVPGADLIGFGDITSYETMNNVSDIFSKCDAMKASCKAFSYLEGKEKPRVANLKRALRIPDSSPLNLYVKKEFLPFYLQVNLECPLPLINVSEDTKRCKIPVLDPYSKDIAHLISTKAPMKCNDKELYTTLDNNVLRLMDDKRNDTNLVNVVAQPIRRTDVGNYSDYFFHLGKTRYLTRENSSFVIEEDLWKVTTNLKDSSTFTTYHLSVVEKQEVLERKSQDDAPLDVFIIVMDGTSEAHFRRMLPKTHAFLKDELGSYMFKGYSIVGDGTLPNINAMLTGNTVEENKEQHREDKKNVDNWPFVFKDFKKHGFATLWSEDNAAIATYNIYLYGFKDQPTDHYARPLWYSGAEGTCLGGQFQVKMQLDYLKSFIKSYPRRRKFGYIFLCDLCHRELNLVSSGDLEIVTFLKSLNNEKMFKESMFIMMSDHGFRFGEIRSTYQGKLEERLPFLSISLPGWFKEKFPERVANLQRNTNIITSPFDVHATFLHLLSFSKDSSKTKRGTSLFEALPENRTCSDAGITDQWCSCLAWYPVNPAHAHVVGGARHAVLTMNRNLAKHDLSDRLCKKIRLKRILNAVQKIWIYDRATSGKYHRCSYQIQIETTPGEARFEVTVQVMSTGEYRVNDEVSRINAYGSQAKCIESKIPSVQKYCYCK